MIGLPAPDEAAQYYHGYIGRVKNENIVAELESQLGDVVTFLRGIGEEKSLHRYAPGKWSMREVLNHINDTERVFSLRALWFARGFDSPMPSFDQDIAVPNAKADSISWWNQIEEFRYIRQSTISLFKQMPEDAWLKVGVASNNPVTVRALAYIIAGHVAHHRAILEERYL